MKIADLFARLRVKPDAASFQRSTALIGGLKTALVGVVGTLGALAIGNKIKGIVTETAATADMFNKLSQQIGIASESLQAFEFAAEIGGTDLAVLRTGLQRFARSTDDVGQGLKEARDSFRRLGLETKDAAGNFKDLETLLLESADAFAQMEESPQKTALAMRLFGRSGAQLLPFLNQGRAGIEELRGEFKALGAEISTETAAGFENFNDDLTRMRVLWRGLKQQLAIALLPTLQDLTKQTLEWAKNNRELIRERIVQFAKALIVVLKGVATAIHGIITAFGFLADNLDTLAAVARIALIPFTALWMSIRAILLIGEDLFVWARGGKSVFGEMFEAFKEFMSDKLSAVWDATLGGLIDALGGWFSAFLAIVGAIPTAIIGSFMIFVDWIVDKFDFILEKAEALGKGIVDFIAGPINRLVGVAQGASGAIGSAADAVFGSEATTGGVSNDLLRGTGLGNLDLPGLRQSMTVNQGPTNINISGANADPQTLGRVINEHLNRRDREALAAAGAGDPIR